MIAVSNLENGVRLVSVGLVARRLLIAFSRAVLAPVPSVGPQCNMYVSSSLSLRAPLTLGCAELQTSSIPFSSTSILHRGTAAHKSRCVSYIFPEHDDHISHGNQAAALRMACAYTPSQALNSQTTSPVSPAAPAARCTQSTTSGDVGKTVSGSKRSSRRSTSRWRAQSAHGSPQARA